MNLVKPGALLLFAVLLLAPADSWARAAVPQCKPCGEWQLDAAASEPAEPALDAAMTQYKEPRPRRRGYPRGDIAAETEAEFQASLDLPPGRPEFRKQLREDLLKLLQAPPTLRLRQDGDDIVIEAKGWPTRRVTPGEPHARVDALGTAEISSRWRNATTLAVTESYRRKTENRETYVLDAKKGTLHITRSVSRPGLPAVTVHSSYSAH